jgi:hypothetical protein
LIINSIGFTAASAFYGTGLLKMAGQGKLLPNPRVYLALLGVQCMLMPFVVSFLSKEVKMAENPVDASLEYQWRSVPQIVAFIKIYDWETQRKVKK